MQNSTPFSAPTRPKRAFGRSLADFHMEGKDTPHGLWPAEESLLTAVARGVTCDIARILPETMTAENQVRGEFLRFLLLGGDEDAPVHEKGVALNGAVVEGDIDLKSALVACPLYLWKCRVKGKLIGRNAQFGCLNLDSSHIQGIKCDGALMEGDVFLRNGFAAEGEVRFNGAQIRGHFNCANGRFNRPDGGTALNCDCAKMANNVFLGNGFAAEGGVQFIGAQINGALDCIKGVFKSTRGPALNCGRSKVAGTVFLSNGFSADGGVNFINAEVAGDFACNGGNFRNLKPAELTLRDEPSAGIALNLSGARVGGAIWLGPAAAPNSQRPDFKGSINLQGAHVAVVIDDIKSWPTATLNTEDNGELPCVIKLNGFSYGRFAGVAPTDAATRREWLLRQPPDHLGKSFRPQPFEQLVKVLRSMGHDDDARQIAMFKQELLQPLRVARTVWWWRPFVWLIGKFWGLFAGYGYRPHRLIVTLIMLWLASAMTYEIAANYAQFIPADSQVWTSPDLRKDCEPNWTACDEVARMIGFNALVYSADVLIPVIDLRQRTTWTPRPGWVRWLTWFESVAGSFCVILLGAILSGLVKRD